MLTNVYISEEPTEVTLIDIKCTFVFKWYMLQEFTHFTHCVAICAYFYVTVTETPKTYYVIYEWPLTPLSQRKSIGHVIPSFTNGHSPFGEGKSRALIKEPGGKSSL